MGRHFIMASHGTLAQGMKNAIEIILGSQPNLFSFCAYVKGNEDITQSVNQFMRQFATDDEIIIVTDIFGGSVNNEIMKYLTNTNIHLITGLNLSLMIQLLTNNEPVAILIEEAIKSSTQSIQYCNQTLKHCAIADNDF